METSNYQVLEKKQKFQTKMYAVFCGILLIWLGFYGYKHWSLYDAAKNGIGSGEEFTAFLKEEAICENV